MIGKLRAEKNCCGIREMAGDERARALDS